MQPSNESLVVKIGDSSIVLQVALVEPHVAVETAHGPQQSVDEVGIDFLLGRRHCRIGEKRDQRPSLVFCVDVEYDPASAVLASNSRQGRGGMTMLGLREPMTMSLPSAP